jgi:4-amino-4-deoxy-L-arabinose transferase-like glycosyltransferase
MKKLPILAILLVSAALNLYNIDFPFGYHGDEPKKVHFVLSGDQDFHHPILMLQLSRCANWALGRTTEQDVVILGRSCSALCGVGVVFASFWLASQIMPVAWALLAAVGVAISPTMVIHAHYFKEDVLLTACALFSFRCFISFIRRTDLGTTMWLGVATGLALASHYKSLLLIALYLVFPLLRRSHHGFEYYRYLALAMILAAWIFLSINWPLFENFHVFIEGVEHEADHVLAGHDLRIGGFTYYFCFHLLYSLVPGMTLALTVLALSEILLAVPRWSMTSWEERLLIAFAAVFYAVPEFAPLKPDPDFARYVLPVVPVLIVLACRRLYMVSIWLTRSKLAWLPVGLGFACLGFSGYDTLLLDYYLTRDTRAEAASWIAATGEKAWFEQYGGTARDTWTFAHMDLAEARAANARYLVASSFMYDRYFRGSKLKNQSATVYEGHRCYVELFRYPYVEFRPKYKSFVFSNPTIRIVDIQGRQINRRGRNRLLASDNTALTTTSPKDK